MPFSGKVDRAAILDRIAAHPLGDAPQAMRKNFAQLVLGHGEAFPGAPDAADPRDPGGDAPDVLWFHGGGYVFGAPRTHARIAGYLGDRHGISTRLPPYRRAPEHMWPAQLDDALASVGDGPVPILAGDSAGGHLALVTALELARRGRRPPALLLFSPNTDRTGRNDQRAAVEGLDPMVDDAADRRLAELVFGDRPADDPQVSPLLDDLSLLPPTWIEVGAPEVLRLDAVLLHERARAAGAEVHLTETPGLPHMGQLWAPYWDVACASLDRAAGFARDVARRTDRAAS